MDVLDRPRPQDKDNPLVKELFCHLNKLQWQIAFVKKAKDDQRSFTANLMEFDQTVSKLRLLLENHIDEIVEYWTGGDSMFLIVEWHILTGATCDFSKEIEAVREYDEVGANVLEELVSNLA